MEGNFTTALEETLCILETQEQQNQAGRREKAGADLDGVICMALKHLTETASLVNIAILSS